MEESLKLRFGRDNGSGRTGSQEETHTAALVAKATDTLADIALQRGIADEFHLLKLILKDLVGELGGRHKENAAKALVRLQALEQMCHPGGSHKLSPLSDAIGGQNLELGNIMQSWSLLAADADPSGKRGRDSDDLSSSDDDLDWDLAVFSFQKAVQKLLRDKLEEEFKDAGVKRKKPCRSF